MSDVPVLDIELTSNLIHNKATRLPLFLISNNSCEHTHANNILVRGGNGSAYLDQMTKGLILILEVHFLFRTLCIEDKRQDIPGSAFVEA